MATNTLYNPQNKNLFEKEKLNKAAQGYEFTVTAGTTQNLDIAISDDALVMDSCILIDGAVKGDKWTMQVIHPTNGVVFQGVTDWRVDFTTLNQPIPKANFPAKVYAGLTLRIVYTSVGQNNVWVCVNLDKDKVLV
jgi:hypothetical protein